jgi:hypothetical protein
MASFGGLCCVVLGHGCHDPSSAFFAIRIIPFSPTFASLLRLKLCRIFVFDCWKVPVMLLCVLVDVLLVFFQSAGVFLARKNGSLQKSCFRSKLRYNSMPQHHIANNQPEEDQPTEYDEFWRLFFV